MSIVRLPSSRFTSRVEVARGPHPETGERVFLFTLVGPAGSVVIHALPTVGEVARVAGDILAEGTDVVWADA